MQVRKLSSNISYKIYGIMAFFAMKQTKVVLITIVFLVEMSNLLSSYFLPTFYHLKAFYHCLSQIFSK